MKENSKTKVDDLKKMLEGKKQDHGPGTMDQGPKSKTGEETPLELQALQVKLNDAEKEVQQNQEKLLRVMADFDNYKKRISRDHEERARYSHETLVKELIPVLDDFDRVLAHLPTESSPATQSMIDGVQLTQRHFMTAMKKLGLHEMETQGKMFDPHFHEALSQVESDEPAGQIVTCHRKGYLLHERLIRPALVTVAREKTN